MQKVFEAIGSASLDAELIFDDDNSQDGSMEVVDSLKLDYPVNMIVRTKERGLSTAVLRGFEDAKGEIWITSLDWDVRWLDTSNNPNKISEKLRKDAIRIREAIESIMDAGASGDL